MQVWIWALIPLIAIIGSFFLEYQKTKAKMMTKSHQNEEEVEDMRKLVNALKTRIENLEAIAAGAPDQFKEETGAGAGMSEIEIEESELKEENKRQVSDIANKQRE